MAQPWSRPAVAVAWREQSRWSQAANAQKASVGRTRTVAFALTVAGAVLGTGAAQLAGPVPVLGRVLAIGSAFALGLAALAYRRVSGLAVEDWTRLRSTSEAVKAEVYTYLAGVDPYRVEDPDRVLLDRIGRIVSDAGRLHGYLTGVEPKPRAVPSVDGVASYFTVRVQGQIAEYYRPREALMARRVRAFQWAQLLLGLAAAALAAVAGVLAVSGVSAWIGVATTVSATVAAHAAASRFEFQQVEYARTANELERLCTRWIATRNRTADDDDAAVHRAEEIISIQNDGWMVKWTTDWDDAA
jgi:hypothetical protein